MDKLLKSRLRDALLFQRYVFVFLFVMVTEKSILDDEYSETSWWKWRNQVRKVSKNSVEIIWWNFLELFNTYYIQVEKRLLMQEVQKVALFQRSNV